MMLARGLVLLATLVATGCGQRADRADSGAADSAVAGATDAAPSPQVIAVGAA